MKKIDDLCIAANQLACLRTDYLALEISPEDYASKVNKGADVLKKLILKLEEMKTQEFYNFESKFYKLVDEINEARKCYNNEDWLTDELYRVVLKDKIKKIKEAINEAVETNVL